MTPCGCSGSWESVLLSSPNSSMWGWDFWLGARQYVEWVLLLVRLICYARPAQKQNISQVWDLCYPGAFCFPPCWSMNYSLQKQWTILELCVSCLFNQRWRKISTPKQCGCYEKRRQIHLYWPLVQKYCDLHHQFTTNVCRAAGFWSFLRYCWVMHCKMRCYHWHYYPWICTAAGVDVTWCSNCVLPPVTQGCLSQHHNAVCCTVAHFTDYKQLYGKLALCTCILL